MRLMRASALSRGVEGGQQISSAGAGRRRIEAASSCKGGAASWRREMPANSTNAYEAGVENAVRYKRDVGVGRAQS